MDEQVLPIPKQAVTLLTFILIIISIPSYVSLSFQP